MLVHGGLICFLRRLFPVLPDLGAVAHGGLLPISHHRGADQVGILKELVAFFTELSSPLLMP